MNQAALGKLLRIDLRSVWKSDASDFAPWVAENIELIGDALGLDLEVVGHHRGLGESPVDVLAHDRTRDRRVLIESRLEETDHAHLGQLITHAASLQASVVVWLSRELRDEHRQAIAWLNRGHNAASEYFGIVVEVLQIDNSRPAANLRVVASPAQWARSLNRTTDSKSATQTAPAPVTIFPSAAPVQPGTVTRGHSGSAALAASDANTSDALYLQFFQRLLKDLHHIPGLTAARRPEPQSWYSFSAATRGFQYVASFDQGDRVWAELYIDFGNRARNVAAFERLRLEKSVLEQAFGEPLEWDYGQGRRACRIAVSRPGKIDDSAEALDGHLRWAADHVLRLHTTFSSHLASAATPAGESPNEPPSPTHKSPGRIGIEMLLPKSYSGTGTA